MFHRFWGFHVGVVLRVRKYATSCLGSATKQGCKPINASNLEIDPSLPVFQELALGQDATAPVIIPRQFALVCLFRELGLDHFASGRGKGHDPNYPLVKKKKKLMKMAV